MLLSSATAEEQLSEALNSNAKCGPSVSSYADAARVLSGGASSPNLLAAHRVALCRALLEYSQQLAPPPTNLILKHVYYALVSSKPEFDSPDERTQYWNLLADIRVVNGGPACPNALLQSASRTLRSTSSKERIAVCRAICANPCLLDKPLESLVSVAAASLSHLDEPVVRLAAQLALNAYADAQKRCLNPRRIMGCLLPELVNAAFRSYGIDQGFAEKAANIVCDGLFASVSGVLERRSYFSELYDWMRDAAPPDQLFRVTEMLLRGSVSSARSSPGGNEPGRLATESHGIRFNNADGKHRSKLVGDEIGSNPSFVDDAEGQPLPRAILIPLILFKYILNALTDRLKNRDQSFVVDVLRAIESALKTAFRFGIYRISYDARPTTRSASRSSEDSQTMIESGNEHGQGFASKKRKLRDGTTAVSSPKDIHETPAGDVILAAISAVSLRLSELSEECRVLDSASQSRRTDEFSRNSLALSFEAGCRVICQALKLSLDACMKDCEPIRSILTIVSASVPDFVLHSLSSVFIALIEAHAATRQLPQFFSEFLAGRKSLLEATFRLWNVEPVRASLSRALFASPRGHAATIVHTLSCSSLLPHAAAQIAFLVSFVLESVPLSENDGVLKEIESELLKRLAHQADLKRGNRLDYASYIPHVTLFSSLLYEMTASGESLNSGKLTVAICQMDQISQEHKVETRGTMKPARQHEVANDNMCIARPEHSNSFERLLALGEAWKKTTKRKKRSTEESSVIRLNTLCHYLRFFVSLAHNCALAEVPAQETISSHQSAGIRLVDVLRESWLLVDCLCEGIFALDAARPLCVSQSSDARINVNTVTEPLSRRCVQLSGSLATLMASVRYEDVVGKSCLDMLETNVSHGHKPAVHRDNSVGASGFVKFLCLALTEGDAVDSVWDDLWECKLVQTHIVSAFCMLSRATNSNAQLLNALRRSLKIPFDYLSEANEEAMSKHCASLVQRTGSKHGPDYVDVGAVRLLARLRRIHADILDCSTNQWFRVAPFVGGSENIVATLAVLEASTGEDLVSRLEPFFLTSGLSGLSWYIRAMKCLNEVAERSGKSMHAVLQVPVVVYEIFRKVLSALEASVSARLTAPDADISSKDDALRAITDLIRLVIELRAEVLRPDEPHLRQGSNVHGRAAERMREVDSLESERMNSIAAMRRTASRLLRIATPVCCTASKGKSGKISRAPVDMLCAICCGRPPLYLNVWKDAEFDGVDEVMEMSKAGLALRLAATGLAWLRVADDKLSSANDEKAMALRVAGEKLLRALTVERSNQFSKRLAHAISQAVVEGLSIGQNWMVYAARVLLSSEHTNWLDIDIVLWSLRTATEEVRRMKMRDSPLVSDSEMSVINVTEGGFAKNAPESKSSRREPCSSEQSVHLATAAVEGAEEWVYLSGRRRQRHIAGWVCEIILQRVTCICESVLATDVDANAVILSSLRICDLLVRKQRDVNRSAPISSSGLLWCSRGIVATCLFNSGKLSAEVARQVARVHESVSSLVRSEVVCRAMLRDLCNALSEACSGAVRRAATGSVAALSSKVGVDGVKLVATSLDDNAKEVLRMLREDALAERTYKGRS